MTRRVAPEWTRETGVASGHPEAGLLQRDAARSASGPAILLSAGEVSGDRAAAGVAREVRRREPEVRLIGLGGEQMRRAGVELLAETTRLGAVGVTEALPVLPLAVRVVARLRRQLRSHRPAVALLVGADLFHVAVGRLLRREGIPTVAYFPPQVWLWRAIAPFLARSFDLVATSFPEEQEVYAPVVPSEFVGHYLCDVLDPTSPGSLGAARQELGLEADRPVVALLPGSRRTELSRLAPVLLGAACGLRGERPEVRFLLPTTEPGQEVLLRRAVAARGLSGAVTFARDSHRALAACDLALCASGTATLEAALLQRPMVVLYRISPLTMATVWTADRLRLLSSDTLALPNLVLGRHAVPELVQRRVSVEAATRAALELLADEAGRRRMEVELGEVRRQLSTGGGALGRVAELVLREGSRDSVGAALCHPAARMRGGSGVR